MIRDLLDGLLKRTFLEEKVSVRRRRVGKLAGRKVTSEKVERRLQVHWQHVGLLILIVIIGQEILAETYAGGGGLLCLLEGKPLFCPSELHPTE